MSNWRMSTCDKKHGARPSPSLPRPRFPGLPAPAQPILRKKHSANGGLQTLISYLEREPGFALYAYPGMHDPRPGNRGVPVPCLTRYAAVISARIRAISGIRLGPVRAARSAAPQRTPHGGEFYSRRDSTTPGPQTPERRRPIGGQVVKNSYLAVRSDVPRFARRWSRRRGPREV